MIKFISEKGLIEELLVVTNDVYLPFSSQDKTLILNDPKTKFRGTFYAWKVSVNTIKNYRNGQN
jgi:hypothetical protein